MDDVFVLAIHFIDAVTDNGCKFVGEGRVPGSYSGVGVGHQQGMAVLMLQAFAVECGAA